MSSPVSSKTPDRDPPPPANISVRRAFTLPTRTANRPRPSPSSGNSSDGIETLFVCASTKIVSFTASASGRRASPSRRQPANGVESTSHSIPWRSVTERTLAVGALRIYRVTSSNVSFLNSGNLLHTIFPKSQCWCVDGESIFVLRIRQDSYYRIEIPNESSDDKEKVEQLKAVLGEVLQYEKTQCPFTRGFEVALPERPKTPPRRRSKRTPEKAKKWLFDKKWVPEDGPRPSTPVLEGSDSGTTSSYEEDDRSSINTDRSEAVPESPATVAEITPPKAAATPSVLERAKTFQGTRSVTAPINMTRRLSSFSQQSIAEELHEESPSAYASDARGSKAHTSKSESHESSPTAPVIECNDSTETESLISSADSFYSLETSTRRSPSPPYLDAEAELVNPWSEELSPKEQEHRGRSKHRRQTSELTLRASSAHAGEEQGPVTPTMEEHPTFTPTVDIHISSAPSTPPLVSDSDEDSASPPSLDLPTPPATIRMKRLTGASQMRAFSPMPRPQNLFCPPAQGPGKQFTSALIRKTCEIVLGPPAHLVQLMLRIAANISDGLFSFNTYQVRHTDERIPCSWVSSDEEDWPEEDDFGIPLRTLDEPTGRRRVFSRDVD